MGTQYDHLSLSERCRLMGMLEQGLSKSEIARRLGRHRSTIHRELKNNSNADGYRPDGADRLAWARKLRGSRIGRSIRLQTHIEDRLAMLSRIRKRSSESFSRRRDPRADRRADGTGRSGAQDQR